MILEYIYIYLLKPWLFYIFFIKIINKWSKLLYPVTILQPRNNEKYIYLWRGWVWRGCDFSLLLM